MRKNDRPTDNKPDGQPLEGLEGASVEREEPADGKVRFIDTLDAETRAMFDEVLEASTKLARDVAAAVNRQ